MGDGFLEARASLGSPRGQKASSGFLQSDVIPYKTTKLLRLRCPDRPCIFYSYCSQDSDLLFYGYPIYNVDLLFNEYPIYDVRLPGSTIP